MNKDDENDFKISKKVRQKLKNRDAIKKEIESGKSFQEILEFSDGSMNRFYHSANHLFENKRYTDAANAFLFLVTVDPHASHHWIGLGMSAQMCHDYEAAIDAYEMAAICEIENPVPYFYLAKCLFAVHEREATLQALDLAIEYAGDNEEYADLKRQAIAARELLLND